MAAMAVSSGSTKFIERIKPNLLTDLKAALIRYDSYKDNLLGSYKGVSEMFGKIYKILGEADPVTKKIKSEMEEQLMPIKHLKRDPIILVSGQVNSGKSSLINEILESSLVPVEDLPCTSRIVRIKYSEENYYQLYDKSGKPKGEKRRYGKKFEKECLKKEIKLRASCSCFEDLVPGLDAEETVEIGIRSDLLRSGIQIVDTPGMSENDALDKIVQECLDGVLQVLIYVIDANPSERQQDDKFLNYIRNKAPDMKILFACNKCEKNEIAQRLDNPTPPQSDDEDYEDEGNDVNDQTDGASNDVDEDETGGIPEEKRLSAGEAVFRKLKSKGQIREDQDIDKCDHFFQLSCTTTRKSRHGHQIVPENEKFVVEFHRLITHMICHFQDCVNQHLEKTVSTLYALATQAFDFFVSDKFLSQRAWNKFSAKMKESQKIEGSVVEKITTYIKEQKQHLYESIQMIIDTRKDYIVEKGRNLPLDHNLDCSGKSWTGSTTKLYREYLTVFLLNTISDEITSKGAVSGLLETIEKEVKTKIRGLFEDCRNLGGIGDLLPQLESCYQIVLSAPSSKSYSKYLLRKALHTRIYFAFEQFTFEHFHAPTIQAQENWRKGTITRLMDSINVKEFGNAICDQLSSQITEAHQRFVDILQLIEIIHQRRLSEQRNLLELIPAFSSTICKIRALKSEIILGEQYLRITDCLVDGNGRNLVFECRYGGTKAAARRVKGDDPELHEKFAKLTNYARLLQLNHKNVLKVLDVHCDKAGILYAIVPFMEGNLFLMLSNAIPATRAPLRERLVIAHSIVKACEFLADRGFRVTDLRPNNVLMHNGNPVLNLLKWKSEAPYPAPDGKPPFHWAPEVIQGMEHLSRKTYDTYSCAILIWWLAMGQFIRPKFANSNNINVINTSVIHRLREVNIQIYETFNTSEARQNATEAEAELLDAVQGLLAENIQECDERMDIGQLQKAMRKIIRS